VGELDEEMVYESRVGDVFRPRRLELAIEDITHDRVLVSPAPGSRVGCPFWKGDTLGRPAELGRCAGAFTASSGPTSEAAPRLRGRLDEWPPPTWSFSRAAARPPTSCRRHLVGCGSATSSATGDSSCTPLRHPAARPWALASDPGCASATDSTGSMASDDGIVVAIPDTDQEPPLGDLVVFDARGDRGPRHPRGRAAPPCSPVALPRVRGPRPAAAAPRPGRRSPLWQQRQRSAQLLEVARSIQLPDRPRSRPRVPAGRLRPAALHRAAAPHRSARGRRRRCRTPRHRSPYARSLLFGYVAQFVYEGDSPIAERRAARCSLDQGLLAELLGRAELRELLDPEVLAESRQSSSGSRPTGAPARPRVRGGPLRLSDR
jgi:ATP-dependent Lhr-like helicase